MLYRALGATGMNVSALGFGASPLGGVFAEIDEAEGRRAVRAALDLGINFFDVSPFYGDTRAERVLGEAFAGTQRERYFLATKVGRYGNRPSDFDYTAARVLRSVDESLVRLGVEYVDLIQCHDIEFADLHQIVVETIPAMRRAVTAGKARFIGITGLPLGIFPHVVDRVSVDTILSYCHYTPCDTSLENLLSYFHARAIGVINAAPLAMGLLTQRGAPLWHPASAEIQLRCREAADYCRRRGVDIAKLALQFAMAKSGITTTLVGISSADEIVRNVHWSLEPPDEELLAALRQILSPIHNHTWPSGRRENN